MYKNAVMLKPCGSPFQHPYQREKSLNKLSGFRLWRRTACRNDDEKSGFTLIELLVVVLIIGILSAVALPQYQTAVDKARYAKIIPMTRALKDATEVYYLANGTYQFKINDIDLQGPAGCTFPASDNVVYCQDSWYDILNSGNDVVGFTGPRYKSDGSANSEIVNAYRIWLDNGTGEKSGRRECLAYDGSARAHRLCRTLGGVRQGSTNVYTLP